MLLGSMTVLAAIFAVLTCALGHFSGAAIVFGTLGCFVGYWLGLFAIAFAVLWVSCATVDISKPQEQDSSGTAAKMVASTPGAISYLAFSYYDDTVKALKVGGGVHVLVSPDGPGVVLDIGLLRLDAADPDEATKAFIEYMMSDDVQGELVEAQGYIPVSGMKVEKDASGKVTKK